MIKGIAHIGITVSSIEKSKKFYSDILGLTFCGEMVMEGEATDSLFGLKNCVVKVAYFSIDENTTINPLIELLEFVNHSLLANQSQLNRLSISELCFGVEDIDGNILEFIEDMVF